MKPTVVTPALVERRDCERGGCRPARRIKPAMTVLDIGAASGTSRAWRLASSGRRARCLAPMPIPRNVDLRTRTSGRNGVTERRLLSRAAGADERFRRPLHLADERRRPQALPSDEQPRAYAARRTRTRPRALVPTEASQDRRQGTSTRRSSVREAPADDAAAPAALGTLECDRQEHVIELANALELGIVLEIERSLGVGARSTCPTSRASAISRRPRSRVGARRTSRTPRRRSSSSDGSPILRCA